MENHCSHRKSIHKGCHQNASQQTCSYCEMLKCGWYWGGISKKEASDLLAKEDDNVFLVRDSSDSRYILCLSFRCRGSTYHIRFQHTNGLYSLDSKRFVRPIQISEHCTTVMIESGLLTTPVKLKRPITRFAKLDSLHKICRFVIRQTVPQDIWDKLPLPPVLISYVSEGSDYLPTSKTS